MDRKIFHALLILVVLLSGCTKGDNAALPDIEGGDEPLSTHELQDTGSSRYVWGLWHVEIDSPDGELRLIPLRSAMFNANVVQFLAPPFSPTNLMSVRIMPGSDIPSGYLDLEIGLTHPFIGQERYKGFDVRCIFMADGSTASQYDPTILYSVPGGDEAYMLNPDGYTRWWNAPEFFDPHPIFSFTSGALGTDPYPNATLNPYKYFADDVGIDDEVADVPVESRGVFSPDGETHTRSFKVQFPVNGSPNFSFNYAVDASWASPDPDGDPEYPIESFPPDAQCQEAFHVKVDTSATSAWIEDDETGGTLNFEIEIFDWQGIVNPDGVGGELTSIRIESDVLISPLDILPLATVFPGSHPASLIFDVELGEEYLDLTAAGSFNVLGSVESAAPSTYMPQIPGGDNFIFPDGPLASYFMCTVEVDDAGPPTGWTLLFPEPPEQLSDSGGEGWNNDTPGIIEDGQSRIVVAWSQNRPDVPDQADSRPVDRISDDMGASWNPMDTFPTTFWDRPGYLHGTKMALDGNGDAYALNFWVDTDPDWYGTMWCNYLIRCPFNDDEDWGWQTSMSLGGVELAFTPDGYPLCFEDYDLFTGYTGIQVAKGLWQNSPMGLESGSYNEHSWMHIGQYYQVAEDPVALSTGPSIQRDASGTLWLAFQNGFLTSDTINIVHNTDPSMEFWSEPLEIYTTEPPYDECYNPTLWLDASGGMHLAYISSRTEDPMEYEISYLSAASGDPIDLGGLETPFIGNETLEFPTLQCAEFEETPAPVLMLNNGSGEIVIKWRDTLTSAWTDAIQVDLNSRATLPSMWIDQDTLYVHVVWSEPDIDGFMQVWYRRGQFVEL